MERIIRKRIKELLQEKKKYASNTNFYWYCCGKILAYNQVLKLLRDKGGE